jgi:hypothetical protein
MAERRHARKVAELEAEIATLRERSLQIPMAKVDNEDPKTELARTRAEVRRLQEHLKTQADLIDHLKQAQQQQVGSLQASREAAHAEIARLKGVKYHPPADDQDLEQERAAVKIQAIQRGKAERRALHDQQLEQETAAIKIQAIQRGKAERRALQQRKTKSSTTADSAPDLSSRTYSEMQAEVDREPELEPEDEALNELEIAVDALFETWDVNGDGSIDKDELQAFLIDLFGDDAATQRELEEFMGKLDEDKDAQISRAEISAFLKRQYEKSGAAAGGSIDVDSLMVAGLTEVDREPELEPELEPEPEPEPAADST